jgi:hypothetical protein
VIDCAASGESPECHTGAARGFVQHAFRGTATEAQLQRFAQLHGSSVAEVGPARAAADLLDVTLTSPSYVFRDEVSTDAAGQLLPAQHLQALTYTLADAPPERLGLDSARASVLLVDTAAVTDTVERILQTPEARDKLLRFFIAWLEVREPGEFTIAPEVFPEFTPQLAQAMVTETRTFLEHQLAGAAPSLRGVTRSTESFVSEALSSIYDLPGAGDQVPTMLDPEQRLGIFTQPAVIASHSGPSTTRLVKRGVFFTRKVMCLPLGAPPEGVDTSVPEDAGDTERERIAAVTTPAHCQGCHAYINPFGFMQESYDPIGRFRTTDDGHPVDPSIDVDFLDEGPLQASTAVEALRTITESARFQQCFVRQLFRFYMARDERPGDDPVLRQMFFQFAEGGAQQMLPALRLLAGSETVSHRAEAP